MAEILGAMALWNSGLRPWLFKRLNTTLVVLFGVFFNYFAPPIPSLDTPLLANVLHLLLFYSCMLKLK